MMSDGGWGDGEVDGFMVSRRRRSGCSLAATGISDVQTRRQTGFRASADHRGVSGTHQKRFRWRMRRSNACRHRSSTFKPPTCQPKVNVEHERAWRVVPDVRPDARQAARGQNITRPDAHFSARRVSPEADLRPAASNTGNGRRTATVVDGSSSLTNRVVEAHRPGETRK